MKSVQKTATAAAENCPTVDRVLAPMASVAERALYPGTQFFGSEICSFINSLMALAGPEKLEFVLSAEEIRKARKGVDKLHGVSFSLIRRLPKERGAFAGSLINDLRSRLNGML